MNDPCEACQLHYRNQVSLSYQLLSHGSQAETVTLDKYGCHLPKSFAASSVHFQGFLEAGRHLHGPRCIWKVHKGIQKVGDLVGSAQIEESEILGVSLSDFGQT